MTLHLFLIDTNIWIQLLKTSEEDPRLNELSELCNNGAINLLVPAELKREANKTIKRHLDEEKKKTSGILNTAYRELTKISLESRLELLDRRFQQINGVLDDGIQIATSQTVKNILSDRFTEDLPPFHNSDKSNSDCLIYYTALEYIQQNHLKEFHFITDNSKDFGEPGKEREELHHLLKCPGINIGYHCVFDKCLNDLNLIGKGSRSHRSEIDKHIIPLMEYQGVNFLDGFHNMMRKMHETICFVPTNILVRISPFRIKNGDPSYSYFESFILHTNNKVLVEFFEQIELSEQPRFKEGSGYDNSKENQDKLYYILKSLNLNLVFQVALLKTNKEIDIKIPGGKSCDCLDCNYQKLQYSNAGKKIIEGTYTDTTLKAAGIAFSLGFYSKSLELYYKVYEDAVKTNNKVLKFIVHYCLAWVGRYGRYDKTKEDEQRLKPVKEGDFEKEFFELVHSSKFGKQIASFFYQNSFAEYYSSEINEVLEKIRSHYEMQLSGGYSSNSNYYLLITRYAEFESFCRLNSLPFFKFSDYGKITKSFFEGIFMCFALNEYQSSKIQYFNDYILEQLLHYSTASDIIDLYTSYAKRPIPFKIEDSTSSFQSRVLDYLGEVESFLQIEVEAEEGLHTTHHHYFERFWNIVTILSIVKFDDAFISQCAELILKFIDHLPRVRSRDVRYLGNFIGTYGQLLGKDTLKHLFDKFINDNFFHEERLLTAFTGRNATPPFLLIDDDGTYETVCKNFLDKCDRCNSYHTDIICELYRLMDEGNKKKLSYAIKQRLEDKFDHNTFYDFAAYEMIDANYFKDIYLKCFERPTNPNGPKHPFLRGEIIYQGLNEAMQLAFKYDWVLYDDFVAKFKGLTDYYDWLIDMDNFDYEKFNPLWVLQFQVRDYFKRIFAVPQVRQKVKEYLKYHHQPSIAKYYTQYVG
jgi:hypothetical protein